MRRLVPALLVLGIATSAALVAEKDLITVDLKSCKFKPMGTIPAELFGYSEGEERLFFYANGTAEATVETPVEGKYEIVIKASCDSAQKERAKFKLAVDGQAVGKETLLSADEAKEYQFTAKLKAGKRIVAVEFTNDVYKENEFDRNLYVHAVTLKKVE